MAPTTPGPEYQPGTYPGNRTALLIPAVAPELPALADGPMRVYAPRHALTAPRAAPKVRRPLSRRTVLVGVFLVLMGLVIAVLAIAL